MEKLAIKYAPGHELTHLPGEATRTIDQGQSGEAADEKGAQLHSSGADVLELQRQSEEQQSTPRKSAVATRSGLRVSAVSARNST